MALVVKDRVKQFSTTTGTGTITLGATPTGFQAFSVLGDGSTTYYAIVDNNNGDWEVGLGTYTLSGTTLSRNTVLASSNGGSLVNFGSDSKEVFVTYPAEKAVYEQANGAVELPGDLNFTGSTSSITGPFTPTPSPLTRGLVFKTTTPNNHTALTVMPNGVGSGGIGGSTSLGFLGYDPVTTAQGYSAGISLDSIGDFRFGSSYVGPSALTPRPITFWIGTDERLKIWDNGSNKELQINSDTVSSGDLTLARNGAPTINIGNSATFGSLSTLARINFNDNNFQNSPIKAQIRGLNEGTAGTNIGGQLRFMTKPDGAGTAADRMCINNVGNVGIGTTSPTQPLDVNGNVAITGTGRRITGDFSNATVANRVLFQTSTVNGQTSIGVLPNGTSTSANLTLFGGTDPANASIGQLVNTGTEVRLSATNAGTGTFLPMTFATGGSERVRIDTDGDLINKGVFYYNARTIAANVTLSATENAMSIGPLVINDGVVVTVPDGGSWSVL